MESRDRFPHTFLVPAFFIWGDYGGIARDPSTDDMWLYHEYAKPSNQWGTWIGKTKFP